MFKLLKEQMRVYDNAPHKLNPIIFILPIHVLFTTVMDIHIKAQTLLYLGIAIASIVLGSSIDYLVLAKRNPAYLSDKEQRKYLQIAYFLFASILSSLAALMIFILSFFF